MGEKNRFASVALLASPTERAQEAATRLRGLRDWAPIDAAEAVVVLGGDGFMLQVLHQMLDDGRVIPAYGVNLGTVGFLMNRNRGGVRLLERVNKAKRFVINPLRMEAVTQKGESHTLCAINEVSLLRETRQTAKIEVAVDRETRLELLFDPGHSLDERIAAEQFMAG